MLLRSNQHCVSKHYQWFKDKFSRNISYSQVMTNLKAPKVKFDDIKVQLQVHHHSSAKSTRTISKLNLYKLTCNLELL